MHGGAKEIELFEEQANREGLGQAAEAGRRVLAYGGSAVDAVECAIQVLESLPVFNAGVGSALNAAGGIEMCAGLMDGSDRSVGAVTVIRDVRHPISVARRLLPEKEILLAGEGALMFAREQQLELADQHQLRSEAAPAQQEHDTVGAVALDRRGHLAAGTSTGGLTGSRVGRIGDSPQPGCGLYADDGIGGVSLSGDGETIARVLLASNIMNRLKNGEEPQGAISTALAELPEVGGDEADGGAIAITRDGRWAWSHNSPHFAVAFIDESMEEPGVWLAKSEDTVAR
ncbi:MAG TPA: isoaspartyl peptidase/L-asparaginase family protein [Allosphingosinicella sp.]